MAGGAPARARQPGAGRPAGPRGGLASAGIRTPAAEQGRTRGQLRVEPGGGGGWTIDGEAHRAFLLRDEEIVLGHPGGWWGFIYRRGRDLAGLAR